MLSVIIPTCDRTESLTRCLEQLDGASEIVVSDDSRVFATRDLLVSRFPSVRWVQGPLRGPAANRNNGARFTTGEWLVFIDDDCIPAKNWLGEMAKAIPGADVIEGKTVCPEKTSHFLEEVIENQTGGLLWSCNLAIRRDLFEQLGGFDEDFLQAGGEDLEFAWRIKQKGLTVRFAPGAIVYHPARMLSLLECVCRVFRIRWHLLYRLKTCSSPSATLDEFLDLIRVTGRTVLFRERDWVMQRLFRLFLQWLLLPAWVPYLGYWEAKFRKELSQQNTLGYE